MNAKPAPNRDAPPDLTERVDGPALIALRGDEGAGHEFRLGSREYDWHSHRRGQILCIDSGLAHVRTAHGSWLLPPHRAGWIPAGERHKVSVSGALGGWSVLVLPELCGTLPARPRVVGVSELLRALVRRAVTWSQQDLLDAAQRRIAEVLLDEMRNAPQADLHLPMPSDRRAARIARAVFEAPGSVRTLEDWAEWGGVSPRTLSRLFGAQTGMSFARWRQQARLVHALERLAAGTAVADVADALGYATPSNFIAMFRRSFGQAPGRYFADRHGAMP